MKIKKQAVVKQVLTPSYREKLNEELETKRRRLQTEIEQLEFQLQQRIKENSDPKRRRFLKEKYEKEMKERKEKIERSSFQASRIEALPDDTELPVDRVDVEAHVEVGDVWDDVYQEDEIIVEDGRVKAIRKRGET
ncbi:YlqD protein [Salsuginibacillus halophilus]|uniref:YlqD protein n=1 Tax=Salsuginibacillus halophilus TaxID=517424 RepID=A0A2P8HY95_9BACI|nr:YlqD family protein [Salsuginibacillus halophilus]PSL51167.1 YlqD protein [Salsuginibacillus halophilus]